MTSASEKKLPGEFELIAKYFAPLATAPSAFDLVDDVALLRVSARKELVLKTDSTIEAVHFLKADPPEQVAQKALRRALSDLAAKGAEPIGYLLAIALPNWVRVPWLARFVKGLQSDQRRYEISLLGGDTARSDGPLCIAVTMLGRMPGHALPRRNRAAPGQLVFVSGTVGDAGLGLALLKKGKRVPSAPIKRYRLPEPRLALGRVLGGLARASIDVSDGLLADLGHVAEASSVRIEIAAARIPLSRAVKKHWGSNALARAVGAGDDYEIAFTCSARDKAKVLAAARKARTRLSEIGVVRKGRGVALLDGDGKPVRVAAKGYRHF